MISLAHIPAFIPLQDQDPILKKAEETFAAFNGLKAFLETHEANIPFALNFCTEISCVVTESETHSPGLLWVPYDVLFIDLEDILDGENSSIQAQVLLAFDLFNRLVEIWAPSRVLDIIKHHYWEGEEDESQIEKTIREEGADPSQYELLRKRDVDAIFPSFAQAVKIVPLTPLLAKKPLTKAILSLAEQLEVTNQTKKVTQLEWSGNLQPAAVLYWGEKDEITTRIFDEETQSWMNSEDVYYHCSCWGIDLDQPQEGLDILSGGKQILQLLSQIAQSQIEAAKTADGRNSHSLSSGT